MQLQQQLDDMANTAGKQQADARKSFDAERQKLIEEHALSKRTLETRAAALDYTNRDLDQKKYKNEATIKGLEVEQRNLNAENKRLRTEVEQLRTDKENLGQGKFEQDSKISRLQDSL